MEAAKAHYGERWAELSADEKREAVLQYIDQPPPPYQRPEPPLREVTGAALAQDLERVATERPMEQWSEATVGGFLATTCSMGQYAPSFADNGIDGSMLAGLDDNDLEELGVGNKFHRRKILMRRDAALKQADERQAEAAAQAEAEAAQAAQKAAAQAAEARRAERARTAERMKASHAKHGGAWTQERRTRGPCYRCSNCAAGCPGNCQNPWTVTPARWNCCHQQNKLSWCSL